jgi:hypothetical protein
VETLPVDCFCPQPVLSALILISKARKLKFALKERLAEPNDQNKGDNFPTRGHGWGYANTAGCWSSFHQRPGTQQHLEAPSSFGSREVHGASYPHVPLANRRPAPFRDLSVLRLRMLIGGDLLRHAQEAVASTEPSPVTSREQKLSVILHEECRVNWDPVHIK